MEPKAPSRLRSAVFLLFATSSPAHFDHRLVLFVVGGAKGDRVRSHNHASVFFFFPLGRWSRHSVLGLAVRFTFFCLPDVLARARNEQSLKRRLYCCFFRSDKIVPGVWCIVYPHE